MKKFIIIIALILSAMNFAATETFSMNTYAEDIDNAMELIKEGVNSDNISRSSHWDKFIPGHLRMNFDIYDDVRVTNVKNCFLKEKRPTPSGLDLYRCTVTINFSSF